MALFDLLILIAVGAGLIIGWWRGLIQQLASLAALIVAIALTRIGGGVMTDFLLAVVPDLGGSTWGASILGHIILFVAAYIGLRLAARLLKDIIGRLHVSAIDKLAGAGVGVLKYLFVLSLVFNLWNVVAPDSRPVKSEKMLGGKPYELTLDVAPWLFSSDIVPIVQRAITGNQPDDDSDDSIAADNNDDNDDN